MMTQRDEPSPSDIKEEHRRMVAARFAAADGTGVPVAEALQSEFVGLVSRDQLFTIESVCNELKEASNYLAQSKWVRADRALNSAIDKAHAVRRVESERYNQARRAAASI